MDPVPAFRYYALSKLTPLAGNAKSHDCGLIATSMARFGYLSPIVVNTRTGHDLGGNGRVETLLSLRRLGRERPSGIALAPDGDWLVPAYLTDLPEAEEAAAALALNRTQEAGGWDKGLLADVLVALAEQGEAAMAGTGWDADDLDALLRELTPTPGTAPDDAPPARADDDPPPEPPERRERWVVCPHCGEGFSS